MISLNNEGSAGVDVGGGAGTAGVTHRVFADRGEKDLDSKMVKRVTLQSANHPKQC